MHGGTLLLVRGLVSLCTLQGQVTASAGQHGIVVGGGSERHYNRGGGSETIIFDLKVPRHCPLVLLISVRLEFRVN
jgi:hypothetical protein